MKYRGGLHSQKFLEKKRKKRQVLFSLVLVCFFTGTATLILLLRAPFLQIHSISVEGSDITPSNAIAAAALESLHGSYFHVVPYSSAFFFPKSKIEEAVTTTYKGVGNFSIHRNGITGLKLILDERDPAAVVCSGYREDTIDDTCYWSDNKGLVFGKIATSSQAMADKLNHYYVPAGEGTSTVELGNNFVDEDTFTKLQKFLEGSATGGLTPLGILVGDNGEYEMYIKNKAGDSEVTVYFDRHTPFETTLDHLLTFWQNSVIKNKDNKSPIFNYINLRFGNTVYYSVQ